MAILVKLTVLVIYLACIERGSGHVALTFPPARDYSLDFLDNVRTKPPCGMPKGTSRTQLLAGKTINITWHLAYPHKGGFKLELLDPSERHLLDLTPTGNDTKHNYVQGDATAQNFELEIPEDLECKDCTIRLLRQAGEWGSNYKFWSCSDVDIVKRKDFVNTCSGHGKNLSGRCRCDRLYRGDYCQYQDECITDDDCGAHGNCIDVKATSAPVKQCFCQLGFFGPGCGKRSPINKKKDINTGLYTQRKLGEKLNLYWRILKDLGEIEVVMKVKGTSWAGIGWRPYGLDESCRSFPLVNSPVEEPRARSLDIKGHPEPEPESEPETEPEPSLTEDQELELELLQADSSSPRAAARTQPRTGRRVEKSVDIGISYVRSSVSAKYRKKRETEEEVDEGSEKEGRQFAISLFDDEEEDEQQDSTASPEPESEPESEPEVEPESEPKSEPEPESEPESEPEPEGEPQSEPEPESEPESEPEPEGEPQSEPEPQITGGSAWTPRGRGLHGMDCVDMVIGMARGDTSRVWDFYTRDRSTPQRDQYFGGQSDLTASMAWEEDGETTIFFRKKLAANGPTDHDIVDADMHVIWALGQEEGEYVHSPPSGLETEKSSVADFYRPDELKYHGKKNRGTTIVNFFDEEKRDLNDVSDLNYCGNEWKFPTSCDLKEGDCEYFARWEYNENDDKINFTIKTSHTNRWTGIGFSHTTSMSLTDAVIGWVEPNGRYFMMDMWATNYLQPVLETQQNIEILDGSLEDGMTTLKFRRERNTGDKQDVAFTDNEGLYLIFPVKGGKYNGVNKRIRKHEKTPIPSTEKIFIRSCRTEDGKPTYTVTQKPPQIMYSAQVKFINAGEAFQLPIQGTEEYSILENRISRSLAQTNLKNVPGFQGVTVTKFSSKNQGEFVTDLIIVLDKNTFEGEDNKLTVEKALKDTVSGGRVGSLNVDPESLTMGEAVSTAGDDRESRSKDGQQPSVKLYIVVACIAALVLVAVMQASCTIYKLTKRPSMHTEKLLAQSQWRDYSNQPPPYHSYSHDGFEHDDHKVGWAMTPSSGGGSRQHTVDRSYGAGGGHGGSGGHHSSNIRPGANTHSLPRGGPYTGGPYGGGHHQHHPMGNYSSYDRRNGGFSSRHSSDYPPPDHYFMPSQRKYSGEELRVYVDYNK